MRTCIPSEYPYCTEPGRDLSAPAKGMVPPGQMLARFCLVVVLGVLWSGVLAAAASA